ncbi:MAG: hypothetical protein MN733_23870 [Nitrososphaera sp.]|nr:hypothetical protein [Nitrososphaera sp.]
MSLTIIEEVVTLREKLKYLEELNRIQKSISNSWKSTAKSLLGYIKIIDPKAGAELVKSTGISIE